jgi:ElaB/YqjD/DUF883 family membrane-anchored ribosome-binding protein
MDKSDVSQLLDAIPEFADLPEELRKELRQLVQSAHNNLDSLRQDLSSCVDNLAQEFQTAATAVQTEIEQ